MTTGSSDHFRSGNPRRRLAPQELIIARAAYFQQSCAHPTTSSKDGDMARRPGPLRRLLCLLGYHKRSRSRVYDAGTHAVSLCRYCGVRMIRIDGKWEKAE